MAVVTESFSIREYTKRMRSIDLHRCWPFDDGSEARPLLPSILVRRFKWWGDELDSARSTAIVEEEDDQSKDAVMAAISEADDILQRPRTAMEPSAAPTMGYEGRRMANKGKQRTPKKRSIVELFAAAPLIAAVEANSDEGEGWEEEDAIEEEEEIDAVMKKKAILKDNITKKKKRRKKKNKGIKEGLKVEICAWEKEKICKPKMTSSVQSYMFQNPVCTKKSRKTARSFVESQKQPAKEKAVRKKHKVLRTSMLLSRNQEVAKKLPVRSILKNHKRGTTDRKSSKLVSAKAANLIKFYCKSNRHVTFSVKDDTVGNSRACSRVNFPQLQNLCKIFSDVLAASSVMNHPSKGHDLPDANNRPQEVNACEKGAHSNVISSTEKNQSSDSIVDLCQPTVVNSSNSSCSGTEKASFAVMVDLNHAIDADDIDCGIPATSTLSTSCIYSGDPSSRVTSHENNQNSTSDVHLEAGLARSSEPSLVPVPIDNFVDSSDVRSSMTAQKNSSSHSSTSCLIVYNNTNERQCQPHVDADSNFCRQIEEHRSPKDMLSNICYSMGSKKLGESLFTPNPVSASKSKCPGEDFIGLPLNSQGELIQFHSGTKFSEAYNKQNMEWGSSHVFSANRHVESNNGRMNHMEIMSKKAVGAAAAAASYQKNQSDWNQKQCYSTRERVRHWLNFAELEGSERLDFHKNEPMKAKDIFLHCNPNPRSHSFHEYRNGDATHDFYDRVDLQGKCNVDHHSQPSLQPTMRLMGKNVLLSGITRDYNGFNDCRKWNNKSENLLNQTRVSTSENPLSQQWMQRESVSHPTIARSKGNLLGLLDSSPNFYNMKPLEPTFDYMNITQHPQWPPRSSDSAIVNHTFKFDMNNQATQFLGTPIPAAVIPSHPQNFHHHMLLTSPLCKHNQKVSSITQPQYNYHPPLLQPAGKLPHWLVHAKHQKITQVSDSNHHHHHHLLSPYHVPIKMKEKNPSDAHKLIKRPADFDDGIMNSAKKPLKGQSDSHAPEEAEGTEKMIDRPLDFQKAANESRSRPTKLIAGAKHILKPCQRMDEDNCRPIHSTIIVPTTATSGKLFRTENNISNIYNF